MGFGKADLVLQVSHEVNDNGQKHAQYRISNVDIVPETSFHVQGIKIRELPYLCSLLYIVAQTCRLAVPGGRSYKFPPQ